MNPKYNFRTKALLFCAGTDLKTMEECDSSEVNKHMIFGTCVLIPTVLSLFTGGYSMYLISKSQLGAFLFAPLWSWIIFTMDRGIIATIRNKFNSAVIMRIFFAIMISVTISHPLELIIFKDVIIQKRAIQLDENRKAGTIDIDRQIKEKEGQVAVCDSMIDIARENYREELFKGKKSGRGDGPGKYYLRQVAEFNKDSIRYESKKALLKIDLDTLKSKLTKKIAEVETTDPTGLIGEIQLMYKVVLENLTTLFIVIFFFFFFLIIELIPIMIKLGSPEGEDLYTKIKLNNKQYCLDVQKENAAKKKEIWAAEQLAKLYERKLRIDEAIEKSNVKEASKNFVFFIQTLESTGDEVEKTMSKFVKRIKYEIVRETLLTQVMKLFNDFITSLERLTNKTSEHFDNENGGER